MRKSGASEEILPTKVDDATQSVPQSRAKLTERDSTEVASVQDEVGASDNRLMSASKIQRSESELKKNIKLTSQPSIDNKDVVAPRPIAPQADLTVDFQSATFKRLGDLLRDAQIVNDVQLATALAKQTSSGQLLGRILLDLGYLSREQLTVQIERLHGKKITTGTILKRLGMPDHHIRVTIQRQKQFGEQLTEIMRDWRFISQEHVAKVIAIENNFEYFPWTETDDIDIESLREHQVHVEEFHGFVPIGAEVRQGRKHITIVLADDRALVDATSAFKDARCHFVVGSAETTQTIFRRFFARTEQVFDHYLAKHEEKIKLQEDRSSDGIYLEMVMALLRHACYTGASDIALLQSHKVGMIKLKVDGVWDLFRMTDRELYGRIIAVMRHNMINGVNEEKLSTGFTDCALDLGTDKSDETELLRRNYGDILERYVFRVEVGNSIQGKTVTIRINDKQSSAADLNQLGFDEQTLNRIRAYMHSKNGIVLLAGPTGSGKTTSLNAAVSYIDALTHSVQTVERPVEYTNGLWSQYGLDRVDSDEGTQWQKALVGLLRNAPDVILFGETRDSDTARQLFSASNTGHLILSTVHANGAVETIERLEDLGVPKAKMATVLMGVLAQRLVRKLCTHCRIPDTRSDTRRLFTSFVDIHLKSSKVEPFRARAAGCVNCGHTGYRGRRMVYELLHCNKQIKGLLEKGAALSEIKERGIFNGGTLLINGLKLVAAGITSVDELAAHIDLEV